MVSPTAISYFYVKLLNMTKCVFCNIIDGIVPASIVYEDKTCIAFMDIRPFNKGHLLVVPKTHATYLADLDPEIGGYLFKVTQKLSRAVRKSGVKCEGINLFLADGEAAGQEVFHLHIHILPRYKGDTFGLKFGKEYEKIPQRLDLDKIADNVKSKIE